MRAFLTASLLLVAGEASAVERYETQRMRCAKVQAVVEKDGAAILRRQPTSSGLPRYDRYVHSRHFGQSGEITARASVPTADTKSCTVRRCVILSHPRVQQ